jgi:prophage antirepressor-like protein
MDILKCFKLNNEEYKINIQGTHDDPLFQANQIGKLLGIKNISDNISDFTDEEKHIDLSDTLGGKQKTLFLTEIGLYRLIGRSRKPIASTFQKWTINILKEIRKNGSYQLKETNEIDKKLIEYNCSLKNHKIFLQVYDNKNIIYVCKLKDLNNKILIKIGSSQSIKERMSNITNVFNLNQILLLHVIETYNYVKFERFLHNNEFIKKYNHPFEMKNKKISTETYLVNQEELNEILKIIDVNKSKFNDKNNILIEEIKLKTEEVKIINEKLAIQKENIVLKQKETDVEIKDKEIEIKKIELEIITNVNKETQPIPDSTIDENIKTCNYMLKERKKGKHVPIIYQYNLTDLKTPIKIFDCPADVERSLPSCSPSQLKRAAKNNTIYKNFRWLSLKRTEKPPETIQEVLDYKSKTEVNGKISVFCLPETKITKHKSSDVKYIAMIDIKKTKILQVFSSQKEALEARNMKSSFTRAIQNYSLASGHYWKFFYDCSDEMKQVYLATNKLPERFVQLSGKSVQQIDPKTKQVIATYNSNREVAKQFQMSIISLKKASETGTVHNGYIWHISNPNI